MTHADRAALGRISGVPSTTPACPGYSPICVKGLLYEAGEFPSVHEYEHVVRWTDHIAAARRCNAAAWSTAPGATPVLERHDASDFDTAWS